MGAEVQQLFFEDFADGQVFELGSRVVGEDDIVAFAAEWDPQPMHVDREAASGGPFGGLIASGWHTACVWMRLHVDAVLSRAHMLTATGVEELRWLQPVRPGMRLHGRTTVLETWPSERVPERGTIRMRGELLDDDGAVVMTMLARSHARRRGEEELP